MASPAEYNATKSKSRNNKFTRDVTCTEMEACLIFSDIMSISLMSD